MKQNVQIYVNKLPIDIDDDTAIGLNLVGFQPSKLGDIAMSYTNTFSIPLTANNKRIFGVFNNTNLNNKNIQNQWYDKYTFELYIDGIKTFYGKLFVENYDSGRLNVYVVNNLEIMEKFNKISLYDVNEALIDDINDELTGIYTSGASWANIVDYLASGSNMCWIPYVVGSLNKQFPYDKLDANTNTHSVGNLYDDTDNADNKERYNLNTENVLTTEFVTNDPVVGDYKTGCIYTKLSEVLEKGFQMADMSPVYDNDVNLMISQQYIRTPDLVTYMDLNSLKYFFDVNDTYNYTINGKDEAASKKLSFLSLVKYICREYCLVWNIVGDRIYFHSMNNISSANKVKFKNNTIISRRFYFEEIPQKSFIVYEGLADSTTLTGAKQINCYNKNIDDGGNNSVVMTINRYLPGYFVYLYDDGSIMDNTYALDTTKTEMNDKFVIVQKIATSTPYNVKVQRYYLGNSVSQNANLYQAYNRTVSETGYWDKFSDLCEYPDIIDIEIRFDLYQAIKFTSYMLCEFETIPGDWIITNIDEFNPRLENNLVKITAIRYR